MKIKRADVNTRNRKSMDRSLPLILLLVALSCFFMLSSALAIGVVDTKHNLSISGPGDVKTTTEERVCIFCHTPHHANVAGDYMPLWSRSLSSASYVPYTSSTIKASPGQPTGSSRLCLSCHDGTIALGMLNAGFRPSLNTLGPMPLGPSNLGTDLSDDHPISFAYDSFIALDNELRDPATLPNEVRLEDGNLECTSCHDAHLDLYGMFLVMDNLNSALCETCHDRAGWGNSSHHPPAAKCESCHTSHTAGLAASLLRGNTEEETCYLSCHDGVGPGSNVKASFATGYNHPVDSTVGLHDPTEDPLMAPMHVECFDCHNGHMVNGDTAVAPYASGQLAGVSGVSTTGAVVPIAGTEYAICYKCHSSNNALTNTAVIRQFYETDQRLRFDASNPSIHPVTAAGKNSNVPSLRPSYSETSLIYCSDCHNNDSGTKAGGSEANGVHGSSYPQIMIAQYEKSYPLPYVEDNYALCWRCHDPNVLMAGGTFHIRHVQGQQTPCSACHDPHGVPASAGATTTNGSNLINMSVDLAGPTIIFNSGTRSCTVSCHSNPTQERFY